MVVALLCGTAHSSVVPISYCVFLFLFFFSLHVSKDGPIPSPLDHVSAPQWTKHLLIPLKPQDFVLVNINLRKSLQAFDLRVALFLHVSNIHLTTMFLTLFLQCCLVALITDIGGLKKWKEGRMQCYSSYLFC